MAEPTGHAFEEVQAAVAEPANKGDTPDKEEKEPGVSYLKLYNYATPFDWFLIALGLLGAAIDGCTFPAFTLIFADLVNTFGEAVPGQDISDDINRIAIAFLYLATAAGVSSYFEIAMFKLAGARQAQAIRMAYLDSALRQDVTYYDVKGTTGDVLMGLNDDSATIQAAISERVGTFVHHFITFAAGIAIALYRGWELALVMLAVIPLIGVAGALLAKVMTDGQGRISKAYATASTMSSQAISNIRTIVSFGSEEKAEATYASHLERPTEISIKVGFMQGMTGGLVNGIVFITYSLAFWYGAKLVRERSDYRGGDVMNVIFAAIIGGFSLGQAVPNVQYFTAGMVAGKRMFDVIARKPDIDIDAPGLVPERNLTGDIHFENINFSYPARLSVPVLDNFSLRVTPGETVALVGASGSGKSTVIQLLERFYDPAQGRVLVDGMDLKSLSLSWYRSQVGLVSQEPTLFATTIRANILMGRPGASHEDCVAAAKGANAHDFVSALPEGYDTQVGERGVQLSGGQKQRIAISRALLKNPPVLALDEATSALDTKSERSVQAALDRLAVGRTTLVVAHRLSTIRNANKIAVMQAGAVVETGTHDALYANSDGVYHALVQLQQQAYGVIDAQAAKDADEDADLEEVHLGGGRPSQRVSLHGQRESSRRMTSSKQVVASGRQLVSKTGEAKKEGAEELTEEEKAVKVSKMRLLGYNRPEWPFLFVGIVCSAILGLVMPAFALLLSSVIVVFFDTDLERAKEDANRYSLIFLCLALGMFAVSAGQGYCFARVGARLAQRIRLLLFRSILHQEVGWFDKDENTSGAVTARLSTDAAAVRGATGDVMGLLVQNVVTMTAGYLIAFINGWKMTLVVTAILPLLAFSSYIQMQAYAGQTLTGDDFSAQANQTAQEGIAAIRTVHSYSMEGQVAGIYRGLLLGPYKASKRASQIAGASFALSQFIQFAVYSLAFWFGGTELERGDLTFDQMLKVFFAILLGSMGAAQAQLAFPDVAKGSAAVARVFSVVDRQSAIDSSNEAGQQPKQILGRVDLRDVTFAYPTRPDVPVFRNFTLAVPAGTITALVGESGSGKSTIVNLVERFYDVSIGAVLLDGVDVKQLQVKWLRSVIGLVNQEPMLFNATILENLRYGKPDATMDEVIAAANVANAMEFIDRQPDKFGTLLGEGGGISLSGGQKQRIAIARAVLKDPRVLLLDEATSALDAKSERVVQEALDRIMAGRTSIVIAHRLSTVRNAHKIAVVQRGAVLEEGTHDQLMAKGSKGAYVQLQNAQAH